MVLEERPCLTWHQRRWTWATYPPQRGLCVSWLASGKRGAIPSAPSAP